MTTTFRDVQVTGLPGQSAYPAPGFNITRAAQVPIPFGKFCSRGDSDTQAKLPTTSAEVTATGLGFALRHHSLEPGLTVTGYDVKQALPVATQDWTWVESETSTAQGAAVFVRFTSSVAGDLGSVRGDGDGGKAVALPGARWEDTRTGAGLARISFRMMGPTGATGSTGSIGPTGPTGPA